MEIYKDLKTPASKEFEKLLNSQLSKTKNLVEGKIIEVDSPGFNVSNMSSTFVPV